MLLIGELAGILGFLKKYFPFVELVKRDRLIHSVLGFLQYSNYTSPWQ